MGFLFIMAEARRDENTVTGLLGTSSVDGETTEIVYASPTTHRLFVDAAITDDEYTPEDVDDDNIAKAQVLPLKIVENYVFSKGDDAWIRMQGSGDGYQFVTPIGIYDAAGHGLDISTDGQIETRMYGYNGTNYHPARIDTSTRTMQTIEYEHHEVHAGSHYFIQNAVDLAINNVFDMQFTTPNTTTWSHFSFQLDCQSETAWYIYENVTIATPGTAVTPVNNNRNSTNVSGNTVRTITNADLADANTDTPTASATLIASGIIGAGRTGGDIERDREIILKKGEDYAFRAVATAAGYIAFNAQWYEHADQTT